MVAPRPRRDVSRLRPFYATLLVLSCLTAYSFLIHRYPAASLQSPEDVSLLVNRSASKECREVHHAVDQCAFVKQNCKDDEAGLVSYLTLYFCGFGHARVIAFILLACWLGLLFTTIGIAASDFFSVNLSTIASILGLSESLAGVTFLAFGNGSPDVFSTFAAMGSNSASMAVGELIGAAGFITAVVAGSMALVREFKVAKKTYVRDICFFVVAVVFTVCFLADGHLHLWECLAMIGFYVFYVFVVVGWHWYVTRHKKMRQRAAAARGHVYGSIGHANDELAHTPYRDAPDDAEEDGHVGGNAGGLPDISVLEAGPRIAIDGEDINLDDKINEEEDEDMGRQVAAEMTSSMRVMRPRGRRSTTIVPIRPSLVGALEFRSALAHLQKESNHRLRSMQPHGYGHARAYSEHRLEGIHSDTATEIGVHPPSHSTSELSGRHRALSANDVRSSFSLLPPPAHETLAGPSGASTPRHSTVRSQSPAYQIGGNLAPPPVDPGAPSKDPKARGTPRLSSANLPQLQIPVDGAIGSEHSSPTSPFPAFPTFTDSPMILTPAVHAEHREFFPSPSMPVRLEAPIPPSAGFNPKPVPWWPYGVLPPPHILRATLFPTLQGWKDKTHWDKFVSAISVPSILLLVITLPVVDAESPEDESEDDISVASLGLGIPHVSLEHANGIQQETEWQRYRRNTRTRSSTGRSSSLVSPLASPIVAAADAPTTASTPLLAPPQPANQHLTVKGAHPHNAMPPSISDIATSGEDDAAAGWNRWLVALQVFTGPLFAVVILWANLLEDWDNPGRVLVKMLLWTLLGSCCLLAFLLLTTTPDQRPRYHYLLCFLGFVISVAWISTIAGEVVGVLKAIGVILGISEALLGLTVFAAGNSVGDLVADITIARLGFPVMALSACFGGPMLNILLGIGLGGVYMMIQAANHHQRRHPDKPYRYKPYKIKIDGSLMVSTIILLVTLVVLLIVVPWNNWVLSRRIGYGLIALWTVGTMVNVIIEVLGVWTEVSM